MQITLVICGREASNLLGADGSMLNPTLVLVPINTPVSGQTLSVEEWYGAEDDGFKRWKKWEAP